MRISESASSWLPDIECHIQEERLLGTVFLQHHRCRPRLRWAESEMS